MSPTILKGVFKTEIFNQLIEVLYRAELFLFNKSALLKFKESSRSLHVITTNSRVPGKHVRHKLQNSAGRELRRRSDAVRPIEFRQRARARPVRKDLLHPLAKNCQERHAGVHPVGHPAWPYHPLLAPPREGAVRMVSQRFAVMNVVSPAERQFPIGPFCGQCHHDQIPSLIAVGLDHHVLLA